MVLYGRLINHITLGKWPSVLTLEPILTGGLTVRQTVRPLGIGTDPVVQSYNEHCTSVTMITWVVSTRI